MLAWLQANFATVIVVAVLVAAVALAVFFTLRARRRGGSCSCEGVQPVYAAGRDQSGWICGSKYDCILGDRDRTLRTGS
ncbi:MAG: FeoB-associated Cys-rich membrane protein [Clostridia bacterium]|nr:FeoB-associated Cys-rich membrane protein [Clostridia bacterium]